MAPLETTVTPNSKDVREGGQEASPKRESGHPRALALGIGRNPDQVRVLAVICPGLMALGAPMYHPAAPTGSPYTQDQMGVASSPNK